MNGRYLRPGHLTLRLLSGESPAHVPAHLDCLLGAARPATTLALGGVDRALRQRAGAFRVRGVFHARTSLGRLGQQAAGFDDLEERLGLSRTYAVELADPGATLATAAALRDLRLVESVGVQRLALAPLAVANATALLNHGQVLGHHERVRAPEALAREPGDERITVAVVDSGVALGHAEFQRKLLAGFDTVELGLGRINSDLNLLGDSHGRDFAPEDDVGHGSHVAGVIGAQGWRVAPGVAGRSLVLPIRVLAAATTTSTATQAGVAGVGALSDIDAGLKVAVDLGAQVVNMSFGTPESALGGGAPLAELPHTSAVAYAAARGCVLVAATGNSGLAERFYPAALPGVIAVGALGAGDQRAAFSTHGEHVALVAPGEDVLGVGRRGYRFSSGTSHAAPFVAGAAALLFARARRAGTTLSPGAVRALLTGSAQRLAAPPVEVGAGLLDVAAALELLESGLRDATAPAERPSDG